MSQTEQPNTALDTSASFYAAPGPMTDLSECRPEVFEGLPDDPASLCRVVQGLLVHEAWAPAYGVSLDEERRQEVRTRPSASMVEAILRLDPAPLVEVRPPERRLVGLCRHFATLSTALLRRNGIPARARCGFASYFEYGKMVDHWVTEYFSAHENRWVRIDAQLDDLQQELLEPGFDASDMPTGPFLPAGDAWQACRRGGDDPDRFGIFDMWGLWFIFSNVIRDCAALNKMELLPWDSWGAMAFRQDPDHHAADLIDVVASAIASGDLSSILGLYADNQLIAVPSTVFDGRFGESCDLFDNGNA